MLLEDILPEIRKGRKALRKSSGQIISLYDDSFVFDRDDIRANDWEIVLERRKYRKNIYLWDNGAITDNCMAKPIQGGVVVETRTIEWEIEE